MYFGPPAIRGIIIKLIFIIFLRYIFACIFVVVIFILSLKLKWYMDWYNIIIWFVNFYPLRIAPDFNSYLRGWIKFCLNWLYILKFVFEYTRLFIWKYTFQLIFKHFIIIWWRRSCWSSRYWSPFSWRRISIKSINKR